MPLDRRTRLLRALDRLPVDRPPVICTGGSMTMVPAAVVALSGCSLPEAHGDPRAMAALALAAAHITGFETVGVPHCVTVEAEALGVEIDLGDAHTEARSVREPHASVTQVTLPSLSDLLEGGRVPVVVQAVRHLAESAGDLPICVNLLGPACLAASLVEPTTLLRELRSRGDEVQGLLAQITDFLIAWSQQLVAAGADVVVVHEDTLTPSLLGEKTFARVVAPHLQRLARALRALGTRSLLHMCGQLGGTVHRLEALGFDAYVPDHALSLGALTRDLPHTALVGNVSTFLLHQGSPQALAEAARKLVREGLVGALSPACGMSSATGLDNIRAFTEAAKLQPSSPQGVAFSSKAT